MAGFCVVVLAAAVLCFARLGSRDLWQDEGETAVLARSVLEHGVPKAKIGSNLVYQGVPSFNEDYVWTFHPWGQFYLAAAAMKLLGPDPGYLRAPFALCGVLTVALLYLFVWRNWRDTPTAVICSLLLALSPTFVMHARQCRYYAISGLAVLAVVAVLVEMMIRPRKGLWGMMAFAVALLFYSDFGSLAAIVPGLAITVWFLHPAKGHLLPFGKAMGLVLVLCTPGLLLHWQRLTGHDAKLVPPSQRILTHLAYFDGWFAPLLVLLPAFIVLIVNLRRDRNTFTSQRRIALGCGLIAVCAVALIAAPAAYPHVRYIIAQMALAKLALGIALVGFDRGVRRRAPRAATVTTLAGFILLTQTNIASVPAQYLSAAPLQRTPDFCTADRPYVRADFAGLMYELSHDFVSVDRVLRRIVDDFAEPGETVLVNYGDLPLLYHRPDLVIRSAIPRPNGVRDDREEEEPDFMIVRTRGGLPVADSVKMSADMGGYSYVIFAVPFEPHGSVPEPREHFFATPNEKENLYVFVRADHAERRKRLPGDMAALERRWTAAR